MSPELKNVANYFIAKSAENNQPMHITRLLKLVWFAYGWYLEINKKRLFPEQWEAWSYGPVVPSLYTGTKPFQNKDGYLTRTIP